MTSLPLSADANRAKYRGQQLWERMADWIMDGQPHGEHTETLTATLRDASRNPDRGANTSCSTCSATSVSSCAHLSGPGAMSISNCRATTWAGIGPNP